MNTKNISAMAKSIKTSLAHHSPEILTGLGIAGMVTATVLAVKATPKALKLIEEKKHELETDKLTVQDTVKTTWKCYIPAAVSTAAAATCLIGASSVNLKRNATLAAAYKLSENALTEYRAKAIETVGERKEQAIRDSVAKDRVEKHPVGSSTVLLTGKGDTYCLDYWTDRYFKTDIDKLYKAENELNSQLLDEGYVNLNDFYYLLGLDSAGVGDSIGWSYNRTGLVKLSLSSQLSSDKTPVMVIDFQTAPYYEYDRY